MATDDNKNASPEENVSKVWAESFLKASNAWQNYYTGLIKPWIDSNDALLEMMKNPSQALDPEGYMKVYKEWIGSHKDIWETFYLDLNKQVGKEDLQKMMKGAEELNALISSWGAELKSNMDRTKKLMEEAFPGEYN